MQPVSTNTLMHEIYAGKPLVFAHSESNPVGAHGTLIDKMRANSVRIVGGMKLVGDIFVGFDGNPLLLTYAIFSGVGRLIMIGYGTKANQQKAADAAAGKPPPKASIFGKIFHPSQYPIEAAAGSSMIGEAAAGVFGAEVIRHPALGLVAPDNTAADVAKHLHKGWAIFLCELFAVYSYSNLLFSKEKKDPAKDAEKSNGQSPLVFAQSQSKPVGIIGKTKQWMKEHPVIVSSIINVGVGITMMCFATGVPYFIGATILLAANVVQALLVKKREFNVEGALEDRKLAQKTPPHAALQPVSHAGRVHEMGHGRSVSEDLGGATLA